MKHPATDRRDRWLLAAFLVACVFQPAGADAQSIPAYDGAPSPGYR
jgi:hypothetical protein